MIFIVKKPINEQYQYENTPTVEYKIQKGDTLWGISHKFTDKNHQEYIYLIKKINNLDNSLLIEDQILLLPLLLSAPAAAQAEAYHVSQGLAYRCSHPDHKIVGHR